MYLSKLTDCIMYQDCEVPRVCFTVDEGSKTITLTPNVYPLDSGELQEVDRILNNDYSDYKVVTKEVDKWK